MFLMAYIYRLFLHHASKGRPVNVLQVAREAKATRSATGVPPDHSTGSIYFTLPGNENFHLHGLHITADTIIHETIDPLTTCFSMHRDAPEPSAYEVFNSQLRPSFFFSSIAEFQRHHLDLLTRFFRDQSAVDDLVTASFDVCMLDKRTGIGSFWQMSERFRQLVTLELSADDATRVAQIEATNMRSSSLATPLSLP
ncbi:hypothetical protein WQ56_16360 [Luteimonas sp. FCS-9]|nr:hypothetical protein WQ56_16360 [Luteimonas sp. FCS-9]